MPLASFTSALLLASVLVSGPDDFTPGPVIEGYGPVADVEGAISLPADTRFRILFDVADGAEPGDLNRTFVSAARFINMHARAGVDPDNIEIAIVIHGSSVFDVTGPERFAGRHGDEAENANADLVTVLLEHGVSFHVCGQSATYQDVVREDLLDGVQMQVSAMTAHGLLQQQGYTLNPF